MNRAQNIICFVNIKYYCQFFLIINHTILFFADESLRACVATLRKVEHVHEGWHYEHEQWQAHETQ